jgi:hypothetical protein
VFSAAFELRSKDHFENLSGADLERTMATLKDEAKEATKEIVTGSVASNEAGNLLPFLEPKLEASLDETVHSFLKEMERRPYVNVMASLRPHTRQEEFQACTAFRLIAGAEGAPASGGVTPVLGMLFGPRSPVTPRLGVSSRSDLQRFGDHFEQAGLDHKTGKSSKSLSYRPRNRKEFAAFIDDAGKFATTLNETGSLARQVLTPMTSVMTGPLQIGLKHGGLLPSVSGIVPAVIVLQAMKNQVKRFLFGDLADEM